MAVVLRDLRSAVVNYLDTHVTCTISTLKPASGTTIQPGERFTFDIRATNSGAPDAILLVNVRYVVKVSNGAKLITPSSNPDGNKILYKKFTPNPPWGGFEENCRPNEEVDNMILFPPQNYPPPPHTVSGAGVLEPGFSKAITLTGKGGPAGSPCQISLYIKGDPDLNFLFPKNEGSPEVNKVFSVVD